MKFAPETFKKADLQRWLIGLGPTLGGIALIILLEPTRLAIPNPSAVFLTTCVFATFIGGLGLGLAGSAICMAFAVYGFADADHPGYYTLDDFIRLGILAVTLSIMVSMVYFLKRRVDRATELAHRDELTTTQTQAQHALQKSSERLASICNSAMDAIISIDEQGRILEFNPAAETIFGYRRDHVIGRLLSELIIPPALRADHTNGLARYLKTGESKLMGQRLELTAFRSDGSEFPVELSITRLAVEGPVVFTGFLRDITHRRQSQASLAESQERLAGIIESAMDAIISIDENQRIMLFNPAAEKMFRSSAAEAIGQPIDRFIPERFRANHSDHIRRFADTGTTTRRMGGLGAISGLRADGEEFPIEASISQVQVGKTQLFTVILRDITERVRTETQIRRMNDELEQRVADRTADLETTNVQLNRLLEEVQDLYNNSPCGYHSLDKDGIFVRINDTELNWLGYSREEVIGKLRMTDVVTASGLQTFTTHFPILLEQGHVSGLEFEMVRRDGTTFFVSLNATALRDENGDFLMSRSTIFDITRKRDAEQEVLRLQADLQKHVNELQAINKELEAFCYSVSHDLRAPLRSIDGFSQALLEDLGGKLPDDAANDLRRVRSAAQRMGHLIDDLLALSKLTRAPMKHKTVNLSDMAEVIVEDLRSADADRQVEILIQPNMHVQGDDGLLRAALQNLLENAWKFTSRRDAPKIEMGSMVDDDGVQVFYVKDNGAGFDMQYAHKLFGAFQRLHGAKEFPGTGIGLASVQRAIHRHGGRVWAEGAPNQGATIYFTLDGATSDLVECDAGGIANGRASHTAG